MLSLDDFVERLAESGLLTDKEIRSLAETVPLRDSPECGDRAARELVRRGMITPFQAAEITGGRHKSLVLGNYLILDQLGKGGMGVVFKAVHRRMKRIVALKVLPPEVTKTPEMVRRFERETEAAARLSHPNIVHAYDSDEQDGTHFLVMEFVPGKDLETVLRERGAPGVAVALDWTVQAARGLTYAHEQGLIHRDIKPGNLLLDDEGTVKILDLGLARLELADPGSQELTHSGQVMGTADYMAPEQAMDLRLADARSDIYSLGCTLFRLLTNRPLYKSDTLIGTLLAHREAPLPSLRQWRPDVSPEIDAIFRRLVAKRPADRFQTMAEVVAALETVVRTVSPSAPVALPRLPSDVGQLQGNAVDTTIAVPAERAAPTRTQMLPGAAHPVTVSSRARAEPARRARFAHPAALAAIGGSVLAIAVLLGLLVRTTLRDRDPIEQAVLPPSVPNSAYAPATTAPKAKALENDGDPKPPGPGLETISEPPANRGADDALPKTPEASPTVTVQPEPAHPLPPETPIASDPGATEVIPPVAPIDTRLPIPGASAQEEAQRQVREAFEVQFAEAESAPQQLKLAKELEQQGLDASNAADVRYVALQLAQTLAVEAGDWERAVALVELRGKHFEVPLADEKLALLKEAAEDGSLESRPAALAAARRQFEASAKTDAFDESLAVGRVALDIARAARDKDAAHEIIELGRRTRSRQEAYQAAQAALERLKEAPADADAHLTLGRWLWFAKGDVATGLKHLAAGADEPLAQAAASDLAQPRNPDLQLALADQWQGLAENQEPDVRHQLLARADYWYQQAVPGLTGLEKVRAQKQRQDLAGQLQRAGSAAERVGEEVAVAADAPSPEWKPPSRRSNASFRSFLGVYMYGLDRKRAYPFVNLQVPDRNLWTQEIQDQVRGRISFDEISYVGTTRIAIPADGVYVLDKDRGTKVLINNLDVGGSGDVRIRKGIHVLTLEVGSHGQPYMQHAHISLRNKETGEEVPFFNAWQDIQKFRAAAIAGQRVTDVSGWEPSADNEVKLDPKSLVPLKRGRSVEETARGRVSPADGRR